MVNIILLIIVTGAIYYLLFVSFGMSEFSSSTQKDKNASPMLRFLNRILNNSPATEDLDTKIEEKSQTTTQNPDSMKSIQPEVISPAEALLPLALRSKISDLKKKDNTFVLEDFLAKASKVIVILHEILSSGDKKAISSLCDQRALESLLEQIDDLKERNMTLHNKAIVRSLEISDIDVINKNIKLETTAKIGLFSYCLDKDHHVTAGSDDKVKEIEVKYTFGKSAQDKIWKVIEIDRKFV